MPCYCTTSTLTPRDNRVHPLILEKDFTTHRWALSGPQWARLSDNIIAQIHRNLDSMYGRMLPSWELVEGYLISIMVHLPQPAETTPEFLRQAVRGVDGGIQDWFQQGASEWRRNGRCVTRERERFFECRRCRKGPWGEDVELGLDGDTLTVVGEDLRERDRDFPRSSGRGYHHGYDRGSDRGYGRAWDGEVDGF